MDFTKFNFKLNFQNLLAALKDQSKAFNITLKWLGGLPSSKSADKNSLTFDA